MSFDFLVPLVGNDSGGFIIQKESIRVQFQETLQLNISLRNLVKGDNLLSFDVYLDAASGQMEKVSLLNYLFYQKNIGKSVIFFFNFVFFKVLLRVHSFHTQMILQVPLVPLKNIFCPFPSSKSGTRRTFSSTSF